MTLQIREKLTYNGKEYYIFDEPLSSYLSRNSLTSLDRSRRFGFQTNCWRGYVGEWVIENDKLYLVKLELVPRVCADYDGMSRLFPGQEKVFAEWFSGHISFFDDDLVDSYSNGRKNLHHVILNFTNGCLVGKEEKEEDMEFEMSDILI